MTITNQKTDKELVITLRISRETMEEYIQESFKDRKALGLKTTRSGGTPWNSFTKPWRIIGQGTLRRKRWRTCLK